MEQTVVSIVFLALCIWREARGEMIPTKQGIAWVVKNRVDQEWGRQKTFQDVVTAPWQFSGMSAIGDPNLVKYPKSYDQTWKDSLEIARTIIPLKGMDTSRQDPTKGAVFYHDISISGPPKGWGNVEETYRSGRIIFYKLVPAKLPPAK
jgi:spore germination cell wall hydrolase CwlJ-like protein